MGLNSHQIKFFADYIQTQIGIVYLPQNYYQLETRIEDIIKILNLSSTEEFYELAVKGLTGRNKQIFLDIATNNETSFFRDPLVYQMIQTHIMPLIMSRKLSDFKIWSCACSFGQEPFSLSMILSELGDSDSTYNKAEILTTDISEAALERAKKGIFSHLEVQRGLGAQRMVKFFKKNEDDSWTVRNDLKAKIRFQKQNLLDSFTGFGPFDLVLCRNVLIYQTPDKKKDIIARIHKVLKTDGILLLGGSESLIGLSDDFKLETSGKSVFYKKK